jgi:rhodanese-related sulfurtransferase
VQVIEDLLNVPRRAMSFTRLEDPAMHAHQSFRKYSVLLLIAVCVGSLPVITLGADKPATQPSGGVEKRGVKKIDLNEFERMRKEKDAVVLDVRTPREFEAGHVPGAINLPIASPDFKQRLSKLDKSKTYLVHCYRGTRSAAATREMSKLDFQHLFDFAGGWDAYSKSHKAVEK